MWCVEKGLKACWIIVDVTSCLCACEVCDVMKMVISSLYMWTCHLHYSEALVVTSVMWNEKEEKFKVDKQFQGMYRAPRWILYFEASILGRDDYYLSRVASHATMDAWKNMSPMGSILRDNKRVSLDHTCIIILDIAFHCTAHTYH